MQLASASEKRSWRRRAGEGRRSPLGPAQGRGAAVPVPRSW